MLFSSSVFIFIFFPVVLAGYYGLFRKRRKMQNVFLLICSLFFYAWGEPAFVLIMLVSILANWLFALWIHHEERLKKQRFILGLMSAFNLSFLFVFKYLMFTIQSINGLLSSHFSVPEIALPIGISFFTFQAISYVIDVYRGHGEVQKNPMNVGLYIAFFPQLIAGPIVRYETISEQIKYRKETWNDFCEGCCRFICGLGKKVLLANTLAVVADAAFNSNSSNLSVAFAWLGALAYTFQIFFDFSGYSDMAIGLGKMFGFHFLENFNFPYISASISEFWRRWHISLGTWFRDYVYFPLGGSRVKRSRLVFNLFVVWFLTGVWHGANWTFIVWGLMYFVLITSEKLIGFEKKWPKAKPFKHLYTLFFVIIGWVIFRAVTLSQGLGFIGIMLGIKGHALFSADFFLYLKMNWVYFIGAILCSLPFNYWVKLKFNKESLIYDCVYAVGMSAVLLLSLACIIKGAYNPFIYFNF